MPIEETVPGEFTPRLIVGGFTEEVEESDTLSTELPFTDQMPPGSYLTPLPVRKSVELLPSGGIDVIEGSTEHTPTASSPKAVLQRALDCGWAVRCRRSRTHHRAVLYVSSSDSYDVNDVRFPAHDKEQIVVTALGTGTGFKASWEVRDGKTKFVDVLVIDETVGFPVQNWADYKPSQAAMKINADAALLEQARHQYDYNTDDRIETRAVFDKKGEFDVWLLDWLMLLNPSKAPKTKPKTPKAEADPLDLIQIGEWNG